MALGLWFCTVFPVQGAVSMAVYVQSLGDEAQEQSGADSERALLVLKNIC